MSRRGRGRSLAAVLRQSWRAHALGQRYPVVRNANKVDESDYGKSALLVYLARAFMIDASAPGFFAHQNIRQCRQIAAVLDGLGYVVDVVTKREDAFRPSRDYDLVISERLDWGKTRFFSPDTPRLFLATSMNHVTHNHNVRGRHQRLFDRRGSTLQVRRIYGERMPAVVSSHALAGFGNEFIMDTWRETFAGPTYPFNNYGFEETCFSPDRKDFTSARRNFLFFASGSQMQKGLDLLLEVFSALPHLHLSVCSRFEKEADFCACYRKELFETPNVHPVGWISVNSTDYEELVERCGFVISPTCSEGQAGSVVQCMHSGLVPLVTREAGIDETDVGLTFADDSLEEIQRVVCEASEWPSERLREESRRIRGLAIEDYSEEGFMRRWREIVLAVSEGSRPVP